MRDLKKHSAWGTVCFALAFFAGCGESRAPDDKVNSPQPAAEVRIVPAGEALAGAQIATVDPATLHGAEIKRALEGDAGCIFRYTSTGKPVVAMRGDAGAAPKGVVKLNGKLVLLEAGGAAAAQRGEGLRLGANRVRVAITPDSRSTSRGAEPQEANMIFEVGEELRVGYRGYLQCLGGLPGK